jgi:hypothetical protein
MFSQFELESSIPEADAMPLRRNTRARFKNFKAPDTRLFKKN